MVDVFSLRNLPNVGALSHVTIGHDNSLMCSAWHLREVEVRCPARAPRHILSRCTSGSVGVSIRDFRKLRA
jgi:hypothetical protein